MTGLFHNQMELLTAGEVERIYRVTDGLGLHRDWVIVPLSCAEGGREIQQPDRKILLRAPGGEKFEPWLEELRSRLEGLDLGSVPRNSEPDPKRALTGLWGPRFFGTRRYLEKSTG